MKTLLFAAVALSCAAANAQVIPCPQFYPTKEVTLSEIPSGGHKGIGRLRGAKLSSASMSFDMPYGNVELQGDIREVKDGRDIRYGFDPGQTKWLICVYGGGERIGGTIEWREKVDPKVTSCELKIREVKVSHAASDWTATATCK